MMQRPLITSQVGGFTLCQSGESFLSQRYTLTLTTTRIYVGDFLVNLEISIVSTSLVSITDDLKSFSQSSWVVTAYLLTYTSFMIIIAKLSDLFGRKTMLLLSMFIFTAFSGGCAAAQTMIQLYVTPFGVLLGPYIDSVAQYYLSRFPGHRRMWGLLDCDGYHFRDG